MKKLKPIRDSGDVPCPICKARVHEDCKTPDKKVHPERTRAAVGVIFKESIHEASKGEGVQPVPSPDLIDFGILR